MHDVVKEYVHVGVYRICVYTNIYIYIYVYVCIYMYLHIGIYRVIRSMNLTNTHVPQTQFTFASFQGPERRGALRLRQFNTATLQQRKLQHCNAGTDCYTATYCNTHHHMCHEQNYIITSSRAHNIEKPCCRKTATHCTNAIHCQTP